VRAGRGKNYMDATVVWTIEHAGVRVECRVSAGCGVVDVLVEQDGESITHETYPDFSTAHERARGLRAQLDQAASRLAGEPYLATPTCALRPWRTTDAAELARHADNAAIVRNLRDGFPVPFTREAATEFIRKAQALDPICRFGIAVDGAVVGSIGFTLRSNVERVSAEIGYWLGETCWGKGIMADAVRAVTRYAIATHGLTRVFAVPYAWNPASFRVLEKAGFQCEGRMRRSVIKNGEILDQLLYAYVVAEPGNPDQLYT
jgi:[ribosomal protein S5]-alanine N-acetyltransferase